MPSLRVLVSGARTMVQDQGFRNARSLGVPGCGVLDREALQLVNALVGNPPTTEALEVALLSPVLRAEGGAVRLALSGTLRGRVQGQDGGSRTVPPWTATSLAAGETLHLAPPDRGGTGLIAVRGGFDLPMVLGSRSTCQRAGFGGFHGRALQVADVLTLAAGEAAPETQDLVLTDAPRRAPGPIRVVPGPQSEWFPAAEFDRFLGGPYQVSPRCDRMGLRLDGPALSFAPGRGGDIISDGITPGAVQVPGNGLPIVLLADAQTTGGYPKIATVIGLDLPRLCALGPGDSLRFAAITVAQAEALARARLNELLRAVASIGPPPGAATWTEGLSRANLIGGIVDMGRPDHFPGHLPEDERKDPTCG
ncbi:biotin-dependent carboxyltransferase family protein [Rhodobacter sp. Har01]|uniref:5-oxoprolinase subunit C family protein n=1 Tax=Rhodobacter sp. Har01 TaxID=2883999 RepID=UPI001D081909|nr:biotin-dependent carboxyltransferase family protein [Rhodobacter sp. Har01]MCB6179424.1 biotin-dependent carboxyltransferase family protein [Rhodobacter sp. Har01]